MAEKITKIEAVRRAMAELGNDAMPVAIQGWVKDKLGIEITAGHASTTKGEILKKAAKDKPAPIPVASPVKLTKNEAVRLALIELGHEANRVQIQTFVKDHFGIEMNLDHVSTARSVALRTLMEKETPPVVAVFSTSEPSTASDAPSKGPEATITKYEAVRLALADLGKDARPKAIQSFVKEHFNIDITAGHAKTNKGKILREAAKKKPAAKKPASVKPTPAPISKREPSPVKPVLAPGNGTSIHLDDVQTLLALVQRVGPETLRTLINALAM